MYVIRHVLISLSVSRGKTETFKISANHLRRGGLLEIQLKKHAIVNAVCPFRKADACVDKFPRIYNIYVEREIHTRI